jgi:hypothetical protein
MLQFNYALLGKWLWRFDMEHDALWMLNMNDSMRGSWCSKEVWGPYGSGVWKCIRRDGFTHHVGYEVGNGFGVLFWHDVWCGIYH